MFQHKQENQLFKNVISKMAYSKVSQTVVCSSLSIAKIVSETEQMKSTPTHVCAKTAFVG
jgi:hypothetical protein